MRKASTYYFAVLAAANVFVAFAVLRLNGYLVKEFARRLEGMCLPSLTAIFISHPWWPWIFVAVFLAGALLSFATGWRSEILCHAVIVLLAAEAAALFFGLVAYALPSVTVIERF
jgi:hypothetical protein